MSDVSSVNLEWPSNISFGNFNENLINEEPTKSDAKTQTLNLIIFSKRQLNKNLSLRCISSVMMIKSDFILGYQALIS